MVRELVAAADVAALREAALRHHAAANSSLDERYKRSSAAAYAALEQMGHAQAPPKRSGRLDRVFKLRWGGNLDKRALRHGVRIQLAKVRQCYRRVLRHDPDTRGTLRLRLYINNLGTVTDMHLAPYSGKRRVAAVSACVRRSIKSWVFPKPVLGNTTTVRYPLLLSPQPDAKAP